MTQAPGDLDAGLEAFAARPELQRHVGWMCFRHLAKHPFRKLVVDRTRERKALRCGTLLAAAIILAERWRGRIEERRVGVVLPASAGAFLANLALLLLGKIPVNLNFTAGRVANERALSKAGVTTIITAAPVMERLGDAFPWPKSLIDLVDERKEIGKAAVMNWLAKIVALPWKHLAKQLSVPEEGGDTEAALLFSSGSTGDPKGVVLTHRNIIGNCVQIAECELLDRSQNMLANLPTFHSFGFTVTMWYPLMYGTPVVTYPSPLEVKALAQIIEEEKITLMVGAPTFFRPYLKRARPEQLKSLRFIVAGAEKTPAGFAERWEETFGSLYLEGYGLTETSPVAGVNLPERSPLGKFAHGKRSRRGSIGKLLKGMAARVGDASTLEPLPRGERGILMLKGPNVFPGYLDDSEANKESFHDGWFVTGDLGRIDKDGFIYIEGRLRRFSKMGGEMVPHGTIEQAVAKAFGLEDSEEPLVAVTGIQDAAKGEQLVLLTSVEIDSHALRERLAKAGVPNLWIPRKIQRVDSIPCLASGKLDLRALERMAQG